MISLRSFCCYKEKYQLQNRKIKCCFSRELIMRGAQHKNPLKAKICKQKYGGRNFILFLLSIKHE